MLKIRGAAVCLVAILLAFVMQTVSFAQENPYAIETKVIKNEQAIQTLRQQQANLYLKMEDLLVKYGELKGRLDDIARRLDAIEAKLNALTAAGGVKSTSGGAYSPSYMSGKIPSATGNVTTTVPSAAQGKPYVSLPAPAYQAGQSSTTVTPKQSQQQALSNQNMPKTAYNKPLPVKNVQTAQPKPTIRPDKKAFLEAKRLYDKGKYIEAIRAFEQFKKTYKNSPYVPDAVFYTAESHFKRKEYDRAIINYDYLINNYPKSKWVPEALLKEGISFIKLGDNIDGKYLLEKTIRDYPNSKEAKVAKEYLRKLK